MNKTILIALILFITTPGKLVAADSYVPTDGERARWTMSDMLSAGSDGAFDATTWSSAGRATSLSDDAVMNEQGRWLFRFWSLE